MCLNHSKYYIRMTFSLFADNPETYEKSFWQWSKKVIKIYEKSVLVAIKMETRKRIQQNMEK